MILAITNITEEPSRFMEIASEINLVFNIEFVMMQMDTVRAQIMDLGETKRVLLHNVTVLQWRVRIETGSGKCKDFVLILRELFVNGKVAIVEAISEPFAVPQAS